MRTGAPSPGTPGDRDPALATLGVVGIAGVNKRDAVLDAIDEYEESGAATFLRTYGLDPTSSLVIEYVGQQFPAAPTMSAAHRLLHDVVLTSEEMADEPALADQLKKLGFNVTGARPVVRGRSTGTRAAPRSSSGVTRTPRPAPRATIHAKTWSLAPDALQTRGQISAAYGGSKFSDIEFSARTRSILLFSDPSMNPEEYDGWDPDAAEVYHFTGEGRRGDQKWSRGNQAILDHAAAGQRLRLFEAAEEGWRPGGKQQRYLGEFVLDTEQPWRLEDAPDAEGHDRKVIVFRLVWVPDPADAGAGSPRGS